MSNNLEQEDNRREWENRSPEQILNERLADLKRRWEEFDYEHRMKLVFDIDREYREATEGRNNNGA